MSIKANVFIDLVGLLIIVGIAFNERGRASRLPNERLFNIMLVCVALILTLDIPAWLLDGLDFPADRLLLYTLDTLYYAFQTVFCFLWILYADYWSFETVNRLKKLAPYYAVPMIAEIVIIIANIWTNWIFVIDAQNVYSRGNYYFLNLIPYYLYIGGSLVVAALGMFSEHGLSRRHESALFIVIVLLPAISAFLITRTYGLSCGWPLTAAALLMIYLDVQSRKLLEQRLKAATLEAELAQSRVSIMLSQIQPHFLYNALNTIKCLCDSKDDRASEVVADFAGFLRGNLDSLNLRVPISFRQEIDHLKKYLTIEHLRFPDVNVVFFIKRDDFMIPALTVQPLVENAIRHGLASRAGTVTVSSWEDAGKFYISVTDDGAGFDPSKPLNDDRVHIGIENTRERLKSMCGGEMRIESRVGRGTTVTIILPGRI